MATFQISFIQSTQSNQNLVISQNDYQGQPPAWHKDQARLVLYKEVRFTGGSMNFAGVSTSYLSVANDADFRFGTGDFTIEWFQNLTSGIFYPRIFSMGTYPSATIGASLETDGVATSGPRTFYFWIGGTGENFGTLVSPISVEGAWNYFAVTRSGTNVRAFLNGTQLGTTVTSSYNFNDTTNALTIGSESTQSANNVFKGTITNFRWTKGVALYTANFTPPTAPLMADSNTKLLLLASTSATVTTDSSGLNKTVTNNNVTFSSSTPF